VARQNRTRVPEWTWFQTQYGGGDRCEGSGVRRGTGIALTASALSITVGVLVGAVITIGSNSRASSATPMVASSVAAVSESAPGSVDPVASSVDPGPISSASVSVSVAAATTAPPMITQPVPAPSKPAKPATTAKPRTTAKPAAPRSTASRRSSTPTLIYTTVTMAPSTTPTPIAPIAIAPSTTPIATTANPPSPTVGNPGPGGAAVPGERCQQLGQKGTVAQGWNVFCQRNFAIGVLTWRPVTDGGGCLSKRMSGIGVDGQQYVCRPAGPGFDRWRRAG
jgi:hypothetical protein